MERSDLPGPPLPGCRRARIFWRCAIQATTSPRLKMACLGISWSFPWTRSYFQVCRGPKKVRREEKCFVVPERPRLGESGNFDHHGRRSLKLCWFPECSSAQIVDDLASKLVIGQVCRRVGGGEKGYQNGDEVVPSRESRSE